MLTTVPILHQTTHEIWFCFQLTLHPGLHELLLWTGGYCFEGNHSKLHNWKYLKTQLNYPPSITSHQRSSSTLWALAAIHNLAPFHVWSCTLPLESRHYLRCGYNHLETITILARNNQEHLCSSLDSQLSEEMSDKRMEKEEEENFHRAIHPYP